MRRFILLSSIMAVVALVSMPSQPASAKARVGVSDNNPLIFTQPSFVALKPAFLRKIVPIDTIDKGGADLIDLDTYMGLAKRSKIEVLVTFNPTRAHFTPGRSKKADLPSTTAFVKAFLKFKRRYPHVKTYSPWNEINSGTQPTAFNVKRAADFSNIVHRNCKRCKIVAGDFLDVRGYDKYFKKFVRYLKFKPKYWGLHNYGDTNRFRTSFTKAFLKLTKSGEVWLTETGGFAKFCTEGQVREGQPCSFPRDLNRQVKAIRQMFKLAKLSPRIKRLYVYEYFGKTDDQRFDAGLVNPDGSVRPAYAAVLKGKK